MRRLRLSRTTVVILTGMVIGGPLGLFRRFERPVRCRAGHLFTTIWMPLGSVKAVRLGGRRIQYCPVGHHWTTVERLDETSAGRADLELAAAVHDIPIP